MPKWMTYKWPDSMSICEWEIFCDHIFMVSDKIKEQCQDCLHKNLCITMADMLKRNKLGEVQNLIALNFK